MKSVLNVRTKLSPLTFQSVAIFPDNISATVQGLSQNILYVAKQGFDAYKRQQSGT